MKVVPLRLISDLTAIPTLKKRDFEVYIVAQDGLMSRCQRHH
ncbi:MAG: hypothetical protein WD136_06480 [Cyanobium sp.]